MSPENLAKQAELQETARQARMKGGSSGKLQDAAAKKDDKPKKRRRESIVDKVWPFQFCIYDFHAPGADFDGLDKGRGVYETARGSDSHP